MRRLLAGFALACLFAALPSGALAGPDLRSELIAPSGVGWEEMGPGAADGPVGIDRAAQEVAPSDYARSILSRSGFEQGYERTWLQSSTRMAVAEHVYLFGNAFGAGIWLGTVKGAHGNEAGWQGSNTRSILNSFGGYHQQPDGTYETIVEFVPGDRVYAVAIRGSVGPEQAMALDLATRLSDAAPQEVLSPGTAGGVARVAIIGVGVLLAVLLVVVLVILLVVRSARRSPPQPIVRRSAVLSPDGRWWWDGFQWRPTDQPR